MKYLAIVGFLVFLVACTPAPVEPKVKGSNAMEQLEAKQSEMQEQVGDMEEAHSSTMEQGLIAGDVSKYYDWDKAKFDQAVAEGKTIYLEFSANWCPTCQQQEPHLKAGFEALDDPDVVGFKIHYKDDESTAEHDELVKQYQIAYQHTKVVLKNGEVVLKSPEAWEKDRFLEEMGKLNG